MIATRPSAKPNVSVSHSALAACLAVVSGLATSAGEIPLPPNAKLVYEDAFERNELGAFAQGNIEPEERKKLNWCIRRGDWEIRHEGEGNGCLHGKGGPGLIAVDKTVAANFRFEYSAWSPHPGDRSAFLAAQLPNFHYKDLYGFHFGAGYGKNNAIWQGGRAVAGPVTKMLPALHSKQRVVIQKMEERLTMAVDGQVLFDVRDPEYASIRPELDAAPGLCVGFYTWSDGVCFDDVRLYTLPTAVVEELPEEADAQGILWRGFEADLPGQPPGVAEVGTGEGCSVTVRDCPTVVYYPRPEGQAYVPDHCVELHDSNPADGAYASVSFPFRPLDLGEVEVELLGHSYEGRCIEISLLGEHGKPLAVIWVDADGFFSARQGGETQRLRDRISYRNRPPDAPLYFQPGRWFTLRLSFNRRAGVFHVAIVNLYNGAATPGIPHVILGIDLAMSKRHRIAGLRVGTVDRAHVWLDNVVVATPRARELEGRPYLTPLREILGLRFPLRKDPVGLYVASLRNEHACRHLPDESRLNRQWKREGTGAFREAARHYDPLLVRLALLEERGLALKRARYHLERAGAAGDVRGRVGSALSAIREARDALEALLRIYGRAFRDRLNEQALERDFAPAAAHLVGLLAYGERSVRVAFDACGAARDEALGAPPVPAPGPYDAPATWANGRFERHGEPTFFYAPIGPKARDLVARGDQHKLLQLDNCWEVPRLLDRPNQEARGDSSSSYSWKVFERFVADYTVSDDPDATFGLRPCIGTVHLMQTCPAWWLEKETDDPDIFFRGPKGRVPNWEGTDRPYKARRVSGGRYAGGGGYFGRLNIWSPKVLSMYRKSLTEWSGYMAANHSGRMRYFLVGAEQSNLAMVETGFNDSAIAAFRERLRETYGTIEKLNRTWRSAYGSFEGIDPREYDDSKPNGLLYEFKTFRQDGYFAWHQLVKRSVREHLPGLPIMNDFHHFAGDLGCVRALDVPRMFKTYDIVNYHSYNIDVVWPMYRMLDSLRKAYGNPLGNFEWAAGLCCRDLFDERKYKACGLRDTFEMMAWGKSVLSIWYGGAAGFSEGAQYWVWPLGQGVLRYSTGFLPVARLRSQRLGGIALRWPTITPKLAILEPTTSQWNAIDARHTMREVSLALEEDGWNYGFIHEEALLEGRQRLTGIHTLVVPRGIALKPETTDRLLAWMQAGGQLVALLPPGMVDQYGRPDGRVVKAVLGEATVAHNPEFTQAEVRVAEDARGPVRTTLTTTGGELLQAEAGEGRFHLFTTTSPFPRTDLLDLLGATTPRDVRTEKHALKCVVRESREHLYVFVVNPSEDTVLEDTVQLAGIHLNAIDLGCAAPFPVKTTRENGYTTFPLRLHPGEGTVLRLDK